MRELSLNVMDIVQNSVRAGASLITVQVAESKKHDTLTITITDNGCGMSEEFQKHMFEPFSQENSGARTTYQGTGLGLSIVKKLMMIMGGGCEVTSELGVGTRFRLILNDEVIQGTKKEEDKEFLHKREKRVEIEFSDFRN